MFETHPLGLLPMSTKQNNLFMAVWRSRLEKHFTRQTSYQQGSANLCPKDGSIVWTQAYPCHQLLLGSSIRWLQVSWSQDSTQDELFVSCSICYHPSWNVCFEAVEVFTYPLVILKSWYSTLQAMKKNHRNIIANLSLNFGGKQSIYEVSFF